MSLTNNDRVNTASFTQEIRDLIGTRLRLVLAVGSAGFLLFSALDFIIAPVLFERLLSIRALTLLGFLGVILIARRDAENRWSEPLGVPTLLWSAISIQFMILETGGQSSAYYAGLNLVLVGAAVLMPWDWSRSLLVFLGVLAIYNLGILSHESINDFQTYATNNFFIFFTGVITVSGSAAAFAVRRSEHEARKSLKDLAAFRKNVIANLSHEMRTPLTLLLGAVNRLLKNADAGPDELELLQESKQSGLELLKLINDLLEMSRIDAAMEYITAQVMSSNALMNDLIEMAKNYAVRNGVRIVVRPAPDLTFFGDATKVQRIFNNLISNALKFTPKGGVITLSCQGDGDHVIFGVEDTGPGIPKSDRARVFERFHQVDGSSTRRHGGTGIGLSLVREHVQMHGGQVWAEEATSGGALLRVKLPRTMDGIPPERLDRRQANAERATGRRNSDQGVSAWTQVIVDDPEYQSVELAAATERRKGVRSARKEGAVRILIADDSPAILRLLSYQLCGEYDLVLARSGVEAFELAKKWRPSLVLTDMMMPDMDGVELCRRLSEHETCANIPVVLLTARSGEEARIQARQAGALAFLTKPCDEEELLATVRALIRKRTQSTHDAAQYEMQRTAYVAEGIAHEIRNPLGFVMNAQFLLVDVAEKALEVAAGSMPATECAKLRMILATARDSGREGIDRINKMVKQVADLGENGFLEGQCEPQSVAEQVRCLVAAKLGDSSLQLDLEAGRAAISAGLLHDVLLNLVKNALDVIDPETGVIRIVGECVDQHYHLLIGDNGPGISEHIRDQIFQPFFTTKAPGEGTGLGLAISKQKILQADGEIRLKETEHGTCFVIKLPLASQSGGMDDRVIQAANGQAA